MRTAWHVDGIKLSHKSPWEITEHAIWFSSIYGDIKVKREKRLEYHGMALDYLTPGEV